MKDFLKFTFASLLGNLIGLVLITTMGIGGLIFLIIMSMGQDSGPQVKDKSVLVFDLSLSVSDSGPNPSTSEALQQALSENTPTEIQLRTLVQSIDQARKDDRITALYLQGSNSPTSTGLANLKEIRQALQQFKDSGKTIIAYDIDWTAPEYYLASVANQVVVHPLGSLDLKGLSSQVMFLTGALDKYGIGVQVTRVGKYKSAVEPFLLKKLSPESREQTQSLLSNLWGEWLTTIAPSRKLIPQQLQTLSNTEGILLANTALTAKLVDQVAYGDEVVTNLKKITGESQDKNQQFRQISINSYSKIPEVVKNNSGKENSDNRIAIVYAEGEIVNGTGTSSQIGGDRLAKELRKLRLDNKVKAIVLRVNSPGGSATASEVIGREIELMRKQKKPVIVSMGNYAASGGYWISMGADKIFAESNTITGSIGVFGLLFNIQEISNQNGITWDSVKTGKFADIQGINRPKTPEELAKLQSIVNLIYDRFISNVATNRNLPKDKVQNIAQGRVWSGSQAKQLGLVDEIGGLDAAIAAAVKTANLGDNWTLQESPKSRSLEERIIQNLTGENTTVTTPLDPLTREFLRLQEELSIIKTMNDPKGIYTRLPFNLRIE